MSVSWVAVNTLMRTGRALESNSRGAGEWAWRVQWLAGTYAVSDADEVLNIDDFVLVVDGRGGRWWNDARRGNVLGVGGRGQLLLLVGLLGTRHCCSGGLAVLKRWWV